MKLKTLAAALAIGAATIGSAGATTITNADGTSAWSGFDWAQGGTAFTTGFTPVAGSNFTLTYFAWAVTLQDGITPFVPTHMDIDANGVANPGKTYEYTIVATLNETVDNCIGTVCTFDVNSGSFNIYYDTTPDANAKPGGLGTGFGDGVDIISGTVDALAGQTFNLVSGFNATSLTGHVTTTNLTYINPTLDTTTATTTLQIGTAVTNWKNPGGFNGSAFSGSPSQVVFQADGNQNFTSVPEPGSLALLGVGLGLLGWTVRRKHS